MGVVNKDTPSRKASSILRGFARETVNRNLGNVLRFIDSRLQYFIDWEGSSMEGNPEHLSWVWGIQSELRDLNYLGLVPDHVFNPVYELLQEAIDHSKEVRAARHEQSHI